MSDIKLWTGDLEILNNDLATDEGLRTAVILSVFTDRTADPNDVLPDGSPDRRGWWADGVPVTAGDQWGSRLWLLERSTLSERNRARAEEYIKESLAWLVVDKVASAVAVVVVRDRSGMTYNISVTQPSGVKQFQFTPHWRAEEVA
jgi:phage gp46-like protein